MRCFFSAVVIATALASSSALAQTALDLSGPAELPPSDFKGQQYIDSRGCAFLRAGYGGQVTWVPRVTRDRKQICGLAPSGGQVAAVAEPAAPAAAPAPAPAPAPAQAPAPEPAPAAKPARAKGAPLDTVASITTPPKIRAPAPRRKAVPAASYTPAPVVTTAPPAAPAAPAPAAKRRGKAQLYCPASTPVLQRFRVQGGGKTLLCVKGDGSMTGASFPRLADGTKVTGTQAAPRAESLPPVPKGYVSAWDDDRLNIRRGMGTPEGQLAQDQVWTRTSPAKLIEEGATRKKPVIILAPPSTKGVAAAPGKGASYVQVGTFGAPANADKAAARLKALGLSVSRSEIRREGQVLQIVYAGPFAGADEAKTALKAARGAGFSDALLR